MSAALARYRPLAERLLTVKLYGPPAEAPRARIMPPAMGGPRLKLVAEASPDEPVTRKATVTTTVVVADSEAPTGWPEWLEDRFPAPRWADRQPIRRRELP